MKIFWNAVPSFDEQFDEQFDDSVLTYLSLHQMTINQATNLNEVGYKFNQAQFNNNMRKQKPWSVFARLLCCVTHTRMKAFVLNSIGYACSHVATMT